MPREATGELRPLADGWEARIRIDDEGNRKGFALSGFAKSDEAGARTRCTAMARIARRLRKAGHEADAPELLKIAAKARSGKPWDAILAAVDALCVEGGTTPLPGGKMMTFAEWAEEWTSGRLAAKYPDHVKSKRSADDDVKRLTKYVNPVIGDVAVADVTLELAEQVMANIPAERSAATRRHVAQVIGRTLSLAVYPGRLRASSPIPKGWLPSAKSKKAKECLYPDEDRALLACPDVPLLRRLAYGFLSREGMRTDEMASLTWSDIDTARGKVYLDENKTDEPRDWDLSAGVVAALKAWRERYAQGAEPADRVFAERGVVINVAHLADQLRSDLKRAGVTRSKLFERSDKRLPIRAHDLRATFTTIALATGKTESWVSDRTGHKSSTMINRYRRKARTWSGMHLGELTAMDQAIPELSASPHECPDDVVSRAVSGSVANGDSVILDTAAKVRIPVGNLNPLRLPVSPPVLEVPYTPL